MFNLFKKKEESFKIVACVDGILQNIEDVNDVVFSQKMMGDGFSIIPISNTVVAPISGNIEFAFPTGHAFGIKSNDGVEVLIHVGIDTVNLNGQGFKTLVKQGNKIKAGQPLVKMDLDLIKQNGYDPTIMVIFTSGYNKPIQLDYGKNVKANQILIES